MQTEYHAINLHKNVPIFVCIYFIILNDIQVYLLQLCAIIALII